MNPDPQHSPSSSGNPLNTNFNGTSFFAKYLAGIVEYTFSTQMGVPDPGLTSYLSDFLVRSIRSESFELSKSGLLSQYQVIASNTKLSEEQARVVLYQGFGERILFWGGYYPEVVAADESVPLVSGTSKLKCWFDMGKTAYKELSLIAPIPEEYKGASCHPIYADIADRFEMVAYGLREVRRNFEITALEDNDGRLIY
jgi:hypothetical protein